MLVWEHPLIGWSSASLQLANTEEFQDGKSNGMLGEVFIRSVAEVLRWMPVGPANVLTSSRLQM
jgi:hypothetical protein